MSGMGLSISLGYAVHRGKLEDADTVLKQADRSMYEDKGRHYHRRWNDRKKRIITVQKRLFI